MNKALIAGLAFLAIAGSTTVYAEHRHGGMFGHRFSAEDRLAFADARIAAVKAGLRLTPDQEKNWPPVEAAVRDFIKQRVDNAQASVDRQQPGNNDPMARLRERADRMATTAAGLKKIADAADPLYKSLDDNQKRRLDVLVRMGNRFAAWREHGFGRPFHRGMDRDDDDRGPDRGPPQGPERL